LNFFPLPQGQGAFLRAVAMRESPFDLANHKIFILIYNLVPLKQNKRLFFADFYKFVIQKFS